MDADDVASGGQLMLDIIDREILFAQGDDTFTNAVSFGCRAGTALRAGKEAATFSAIVAELVTQDAEGAWGIAETVGDFCRRQLLHEINAQGFVLALGSGIWGAEEGGGLGRR